MKYNPLVLAYLEKKLRQQQNRELRKLNHELREGYRRLEPIRKKWEADKKARMRMDGPTGFVMIMD